MLLCLKDEVEVQNRRNTRSKLTPHKEEVGTRPTDTPVTPQGSVTTAAGACRKGLIIASQTCPISL